MVSGRKSSTVDQDLKIATCDISILSLCCRGREYIDLLIDTANRQQHLAEGIIRLIPMNVIGCCRTIGGFEAQANAILLYC